MCYGLFFFNQKLRCRFRDMRLHLYAGVRVANSPHQRPSVTRQVHFPKKVTAVEVNPISYDAVQEHEGVWIYMHV